MRIEFYIKEESNISLIEPPEIANRIIHINAMPGFLNDANRMSVLLGMCEIADRKTSNRTIIETHFGL